MASSKKQRRAANQARKARRPQTGAFRHADGDRRRREEMAASVKAAKQRRAMEHPEALPPTGEEE